MARLYNSSRSGMARPVMQAAGHGPALPDPDGFADPETKAAEQGLGATGNTLYARSADQRI